MATNETAPTQEMPRGYGLEDDPPTCAYCKAVEVASAGDYCSDECQELAERDAEGDRLCDADREEALGER